MENGGEVPEWVAKMAESVADELAHGTPDHHWGLREGFEEAWKRLLADAPEVATDPDGEPNVSLRVVRGVVRLSERDRYLIVRLEGQNVEEAEAP